MNSKKSKIVFTNGCFDILHAGHVHLLKYSKTLGEKLIVGLNSDKSIKKLKKGKNRPINNQKHRKLILESLRFVDQVIIFNEETPLKIIKKIKPDILVKGSDYNLNNIVGLEEVLKNGGKVKIFKKKINFSSTKIISEL
tara:strand:- start:1001 stop:1417 length:417 start_codon:yes stop_codon:yes gene_type:complete